jgi:hypothetical protein
MTTQHTPGPWQVIDGFYPSIKEVFGASFNIKCVMWATDLTEEDYQQRSADLRLIAAAPELLEALKKSREGIESMTTWEHENDPAKPFSDCLKLIDAAIAKATGVLE